MTIRIRLERLPNAALVAIGPIARGKSTLAAKLRAGGLEDAAVINMDTIRGQVCPLRPCACYNRQSGCPGGQACQCQNPRVAREAQQRAESRAQQGLGYYLDATNLHAQGRRDEIDRAHRHGLPAVALLAAPMPLHQLHQRNESRDRVVPAEVIARAYTRHSKITVEGLYAEGFDLVLVWDDDTIVEVMPAGTDATALTGPFVVIGDVHGCYYSLRVLLTELGFDEHGNHPAGLIPVLAGDVHDKGGMLCAGPFGTGRPQDSGSVAVLRLVIEWVRRGKMLVTDSNHGNKLVRTLLRAGQHVGPALAETLADIDAQPDAAYLREQIVHTLGRAPLNLCLTGGPTGQIFVAHAAMERGLEGRTDRNAAQVCNYRREFTWTGPQTVVVGHVTVDEPTRERDEPAADTPDVIPGEKLRIDTGVFTGGGLTAWLSAEDRFLTVPTDPRDLPHPDRLALNDSHRRALLTTAS